MSGPVIGRYLVESGEITRSQLDDAVELMAEINLTMGEFAVRSGLIDFTTAERINHMQRELDARWGEIAIAHGYLDEPTVERLFHEQRAHNMSLGEALVLLGSLAPARRSELEAEFAAHQAKWRDACRLPPAFDDSPTVRYLIAVLPRLFLRMARVHIELELEQTEADLDATTTACPLTTITGGETLGVALELDSTLAHTLAEATQTSAEEAISALLDALQRNVAAHFQTWPPRRSAEEATDDTRRGDDLATPVAAPPPGHVIVPVRTLGGDGRLWLSTPVAEVRMSGAA